MLSLSIVTYDNASIIKTVLEGIRRHAPTELLDQIFIVDNCSKDETLRILKEQEKSDRRINIIRNTLNYGFGFGHNQAIGLSQSRYHIICNPDIRITNDIFSPMVKLMDSEPCVGMMCPRFVYPDGRLQTINHRRPTLIDLFLRRFVPKIFNELFRRRMEHYVMLDVGYDAPCDVEFISGAFMFCRTDLIKRLGGFDERFFLYFEDVDLCRRIQGAGYRTRYTPEASVVHEWTRGAHRNATLTLVFIQSALKYFNKWGYAIF